MLRVEASLVVHRGAGELVTKIKIKIHFRTSLSLCVVGLSVKVCRRKSLRDSLAPTENSRYN